MSNNKGRKSNKGKPTNQSSNNASSEFESPLALDSTDNFGDSLPASTPAKFSITDDDSYIDDVKSESKTDSDKTPARYQYSSPSVLDEVSGTTSSSSSSSSVMPLSTTSSLYQPPRRPTIFGNNDESITVIDDIDMNWEDIHEMQSPREGLSPFKKEIATILFLIAISITLISVGFSRLGVDDEKGALILLMIGCLTAIPGAYFGVAFVRAFREGTPFTALRFN